MANKKISQLPASTLPLSCAELVPVVQAGVTAQVSAANLGAASAASALPANPVGYITINLDGTNRKIPYYNV